MLPILFFHTFIIGITVKTKLFFEKSLDSLDFSLFAERTEYVGVGGNLFAFACKVSKEGGHEGFVGFDAKTLLIEHYNKTLGAERALGQRMIISDFNADILINQYFKTK